MVKIVNEYGTLYDWQIWKFHITICIYSKTAMRELSNARSIAKKDERMVIRRKLME